MHENLVGLHVFQMLLSIPKLKGNPLLACTCVCILYLYLIQWHECVTCITFHTVYYSERFKLLKRRKTGGEKLKKSVSTTSGISGHSESSLLQSCSLPPTVVHSTKGGGAGRSRDPTKGLSHSSSEIGRYEDGTIVWKKNLEGNSLDMKIILLLALSPDPITSFMCVPCVKLVIGPGDETVLSSHLSWVWGLRLSTVFLLKKFSTKISVIVFKLHTILEASIQCSRYTHSMPVHVWQTLETAFDVSLL